MCLPSLLKNLKLATLSPSLLFFLLSPSGTADQIANLSLYARGFLEEQKQDYHKAREIYEQVLKNDPEAYPLVEKVVGFQSYLDPNDVSFQNIPKATATLRSYAENHRENLEAQLYYATFLRKQAPNDAIAQKVALETLQLANKNSPHTNAIFAQLISIYEEQGKREQSEAVLEEQLSSVSEDWNHWHSLIPHIKTLYPAESARHAEKLAFTFKKLAEYGIHQEDIARRISEYYREQKDISKAIETLQKHLEAKPHSHSIRTRLGLLYLSKKDSSKGEQILKEVISIDPDQRLAHSSLAKLYKKQDKPIEALRHRAEVVRIRGGMPAEIIAIAEEYLEVDQAHEARLLLEKARFTHPESPGIHARLAIASLRDGLTKSAARLFRQAEALAEESEEENAKQYLDTDFQLEFAQALIDAGDIPSAETRLRQAVKGLDLDQEPHKYARAVTALAKLWLDQGKSKAEVNPLLQRALSVDPNNKEAATLLE